jgi:hypothetical protein
LFPLARRKPTGVRLAIALAEKKIKLKVFEVIKQNPNDEKKMTCRSPKEGGRTCDFQDLIIAVQGSLLIWERVASGQDATARSELLLMSPAFFFFSNSSAPTFEKESTPNILRRQWVPRSGLKTKLLQDFWDVVESAPFTIL